MTSDTNYEKIILKYCYKKIQDESNPWYDFMFNIIKDDNSLKMIHSNDLMYELNNLTAEDFFEKWWSPHKNDYNYRIRLKGTLRWEIEYSIQDKEYLELTIEILKFLSDVEYQNILLFPGMGQQWGIYPVKELLKRISAKVNQLRLIRFIIHELSNTHIRRDACSFSNKNGFIFYGKDRPILLKSGRNFLYYHEKLKNLFQTIQNSNAHQILMDEYNDIRFLLVHE